MWKSTSFTTVYRANYPNSLSPAKSIILHCGRHSYATMVLSNGMPIESVSRVLGHTNITTTQIYAKLTTKKLDSDLTMLGNKLNKTFGNIKIA